MVRPLRGRFTRQRSRSLIAMGRKQKGFSLIELLIVVAIILIIAAIAIPNLIRSKMAANEASAVASSRTINTSEVVYSSTYNVANVFSPDLPSRGDGGTAANCGPHKIPAATQSCLIDPALEKAAAAATPEIGLLLHVCPRCRHLHDQRRPLCFEFHGRA